MTGLTNSSDCTPCIGGYYCGIVGRSEPTAECSAGYYCTVSAETAAPSQSPDADACPQGNIDFMLHLNTVDSLSRIPRDFLKYFEISVVRHIRSAELRKKLIRLTTFNKYMCNWTLEIRDKLKIMWKRDCSLGAISPLYHNIFLHVVRFTCLGRDQIFTSR